MNPSPADAMPVASDLDPAVWDAIPVDEPAAPIRPAARLAEAGTVTRPVTLWVEQADVG